MIYVLICSVLRLHTRHYILGGLNDTNETFTRDILVGDDENFRGKNTIYIN